MTKFIFATDLHWGYERRNGHKYPLHDEKAWNCVLKFAQDFKPDEFILGGDTLDCASVSHHNKSKPGNVEGLRLLVDAKECAAAVIKPVEALKAKNTLIIGNHEDWISDLITEIPGLEGIFDLKSLLGLDKWNVIPQGGLYNLGKLTFIHGDTLSGGEHIAKAAVINYERSIRFGHFHTAQLFTKTSPIDYKNAKTGLACPCLCSKSPKYGEGKPNKWMQGFLFGYIDFKGFYNDYLVTIIDGRCTINGKEYKG